MTQLAFHVVGQPISKQRPRVVRKHGRTITYTPTKTKQYEKQVAFCASMALALWRKEHGSWPMDSGVVVTIRLFMGDERRRDLDNICKSVLDALNGVLWADDVQVQELSVKQELDRACPRAEVTVARV